MSKQENPYTEERRKQKKNGEPKVRKLKSNVKKFKDIKWNRETDNPFINTAKIDRDDVSGEVKIGDTWYKVRMPLRKLVKKRNWIRKRYDPETDEYEIKETKEEFEKIYTLEEIQEKIIEDMIIDFDLEEPGIRLDNIKYNQIASFCWTFYHFFVLKSNGQQNVESTLQSSI